MSENPGSFRITAAVYRIPKCRIHAIGNEAAALRFCSIWPHAEFPAKGHLSGSRRNRIQTIQGMVVKVIKAQKSIFSDRSEALRPCLSGVPHVTERGPGRIWGNLCRWDRIGLPLSSFRKMTEDCHAFIKNSRENQPLVGSPGIPRKPFLPKFLGKKGLTQVIHLLRNLACFRKK